MKDSEFITKYCNGFNKQQIEAVRTVNGPVLLLAVPGSGKTTVLVTRLGYMVHVAGIAPASILVMTYTVAATKEMKERFARLYGRQYADQIQFRTINGLCSRIIYHYTGTISHHDPFTLKDDNDINRMLSDIYLKVDREYATDNILKSIRTSITYAKNMMLDEEEIEKMPSDVDHFGEIYHQYLCEMQKNRWMDYDDQMRYAWLFLTKRPQLLEDYQKKYQYLCVDEAQDTSRIQHEIIQLLGKKSQNVFMVGDEDQSIYGFRAAWPEALMHFKENWNNAVVLLMEENYRSTSNITDAADAFVQKNKDRYEKHIHAVREEGNPVHVIETVSRKAQYEWLACEAENYQKETAVLFRNNDSAVALIDLLDRRGIPFQARQLDSLFFTSRIVRDMRDIIAFAYHPDDTEVFSRIYYKLSLKMSRENAEKMMRESERAKKTILACTHSMPAWLSDNCRKLQADLEKLKKAAGSTVIEIIWNDMQYSDYAMQHHLDENRLSVLEMLAEKVESGEALLKRLDELNDLIRNHENSRDCRFILSTIHSSKGLEYDNVFLMDVKDGILPSVEKNKDEKQYEEERRLYYVAMTRAKNNLYLFHIKGMKSSFNEEVIRNLPMEIRNFSDVFYDLSKDLTGKYYFSQEGRKGMIAAQCADQVLIQYDNQNYETSNLADMLKNRMHAYRQKNRKEKNALFHKGVWVKHSKFGMGQITKLKHGNAVICFQDDHSRKFNLRYAVDNGIIQYMYNEDGTVE